MGDLCVHKAAVCCLYCTSAKVSAHFLNSGVGCGEGVADVGYVTDPLSFEDFTFGQDVPQ